MEITTYPVKFSNDIPIEISTDAEDHCISNQMGRILRKMGVNVIHGKNKVHFEDVTMLEAGIYQRKKYEF